MHHFDTEALGLPHFEKKISIPPLVIAATWFFVHMKLVITNPID
jgi:hypothetical protein